MNFFDKAPQGGNFKHRAPVLMMPPAPHKPDRWKLWRGRLFLIEFTFVCLVVGIILIVAPWTPFWANNSLLSGFPQTQQWLMNDFVRGLITGLGLVDIALAIVEVIQYREWTD
jgi:hypothetical protein